MSGLGKRHTQQAQTSAPFRAVNGKEKTHKKLQADFEAPQTHLVKHMLQSRSLQLSK